MKGSVTFRADRGYWVVNWPTETYTDKKGKLKTKVTKISRYTNGEIMYKTHPEDNPKKDHGLQLAQKLLAEIQAEYEKSLKGLAVFEIERYTKQGYTNVLEFFEEWMREVVEHDCKPGTIQPYWSYHLNHFTPFFKKHPVLLHEIKPDLIVKLKNAIECSPKMKLNVMLCFRAFMKYAFTCKKIPELPTFPAKKSYGLKKMQNYDYLLPEERDKVFECIPKKDLPIFLWVALHFRRIGEATALYKTDYHPATGIFVIQRAWSDETLVDSTKTGDDHVIACHPDFEDMAKWCLNQCPESPFMFTNPHGRTETRHYRDGQLRKIWRKASKKAGIRHVPVYKALKHSSCMAEVEAGMNPAELQILTDHASMESVKHYYRISADRHRLAQRRMTVKSKFRPEVIEGGGEHEATGENVPPEMFPQCSPKLKLVRKK